jgi:aldose 1-epimerase
MKIEVTPFGPSEASLIQIRNDVGGYVTLTNIGATVNTLGVPSRGGQITDIALGYGDAEDYMTDNKYLGATVGRFANRIAGGEVEIGGEIFSLDKNDNGHNTLHGGADGWHTRIWDFATDEKAGSVTFKLHSPDGDQGLPGAADISVTYTLTKDSTLSIRYRAVSDKDTIFNLTNHSYFNLDGESSGSISEHTMRIFASRVTAVDAESIPTGELRDITNSALDFTYRKPIGRDIDADDELIRFAGGFDHNYVIDEYAADAERSGSLDGRAPNRMRLAAICGSDRSGIEMSVFTDLPGIQFYSGNYMGDGPETESGEPYPRRGGFCLETQYFPDSPHHANFPSCFYRAGEVFESQTDYRFRVS